MGHLDGLVSAAPRLSTRHFRLSYFGRGPCRNRTPRASARHRLTPWSSRIAVESRRLDRPGLSAWMELVNRRSGVQILPMPLANELFGITGCEADTHRAGSATIRCSGALEDRGGLRQPVSRKGLPDEAFRSVRPAIEPAGSHVLNLGEGRRAPVANSRIAGVRDFPASWSSVGDLAVERSLRGF